MRTFVLGTGSVATGTRSIAGGTRRITRSGGIASRSVTLRVALLVVVSLLRHCGVPIWIKIEINFRIFQKQFRLIDAILNKNVPARSKKKT
jgi:hypothetical protein